MNAKFDLICQHRSGQGTNILQEFLYGFRQGIPIALGYIPVSFTFGLMAVNGGISVLAAIFISMTNLTSAGQFAGVSLIISGAPLYEISLATFVINIRYALMSLSLSQKVPINMPLLKKCIMAFGITDEIFAVASMEEKEVTFPYMMGLISLPYWGWALGTAAGAMASSVLPSFLQSAMGIALYAMFIALFIPAAKKSTAALVVVVVAVCISSMLSWTPCFKAISSGWSIIISAVSASAVGALLFPKEVDER